MEGDGERGERRWKGGEDDDHHQDQPDVVGLPDGTDGVLDERALLFAARARGQQIPDMIMPYYMQQAGQSIIQQRIM